MIWWCYSCWELLGLLGNYSRKYSIILSPFDSTVVRVGVYMLCSSQVMHDIQTYPLIYKIYDCSLLKEIKKECVRYMNSKLVPACCQWAADSKHTSIVWTACFCKISAAPINFQNSYCDDGFFLSLMQKKKSPSRKIQKFIWLSKDQSLFSL